MKCLADMMPIYLSLFKQLQTIVLDSLRVSRMTGGVYEEFMNQVSFHLGALWHAVAK